MDDHWELCVYIKPKALLVCIPNVYFLGWRVCHYHHFLKEVLCPKSDRDYNLQDNIRNL